MAKHNNRLEVFLTPTAKKQLDTLQAKKHCTQSHLVSSLILSISERDFKAIGTGKKQLVDTDLSDEAHAHYKALQAKFGRRASKAKLLEMALRK